MGKFCSSKITWPSVSHDWLPFTRLTTILTRLKLQFSFIGHVADPINRPTCHKPLYMHEYTVEITPAPHRIHTTSHSRYYLSEGGSCVDNMWRCSWCNGYRRRKRTRIKSWTRLAFHIALWIRLFSLHLCANSRVD